MIFKIFTKEDGPEMREAIEFGQAIEADDFDVEYYEESDPNATSQMELYDIYAFPAFVITTDDGQQRAIWRGQKPLEVDVRVRLSE